MVFSELYFIFLYLPFVLFCYYICPKKFRNTFILVSGLFFYAWGEPKYVLILLFSTLIDYLAGLALHYVKSKPKRFMALLVSLCMNLGLLGFFKYSVFIADMFPALTHGTWLYEHLPRRLPIGISFFTFQSMSYTIDMYRNKIKVQKNPISFAAFVTLFPQIVAGPIVRYEDVAKELDERSLTLDGLYQGVVLFVIGLGKKVLLANNIGALWETVKVSEFSSLSIGTAWIGIIAYTFQIYFDFSGYSDMAVGLGKALGFNFPENFNYPYMSKSISEFWRRWHMTLGVWFKDYVYFPMGGSRVSKAKLIRNTLVVWFLTGFWHGANWTFICWGVFYGIFILGEKLWWGNALKKLPSVIANFYTMLLVILGWVMFSLPSMPAALNYMKKMFSFLSDTPLFDDNLTYLFINYSGILLVCIIAATNLPKLLFEKIKKNKVGNVIANYATIPAIFGVFFLTIAYLVTTTYNPFLYFNF